jgi:hypothetical protein
VQEQRLHREQLHLFLGHVARLFVPDCAAECDCVAGRDSHERCAAAARFEALLEKQSAAATANAATAQAATGLAEAAAQRSHISKFAGPSFSSSCTRVSHATTPRAGERCRTSSSMDQHLVLMYLRRPRRENGNAVLMLMSGDGHSLALVLVVPELKEHGEALLRA